MSGAGGGALWEPFLFSAGELSWNDKSVLAVVSSGSTDTSLVSTLPGPFSSTLGSSLISTADSTTGTSSRFIMSLLIEADSLCEGLPLEL